MTSPTRHCLPLKHLCIVTKKRNTYNLRKIPINDGDVCSVGMASLRDQVQKLGLLGRSGRILRGFVKPMVETVTVSHFGSNDIEAQRSEEGALQIIVECRRPSLELTSGFRKPAALSAQAQFTTMVERYIASSSNIADSSTTTFSNEAILIMNRTTELGWLAALLVCLMLCWAPGLLIGLVKQDWDLRIRVGLGLSGFIGIFEGLMFFVAQG